MDAFGESYIMDPGTVCERRFPMSLFQKYLQSFVDAQEIYLPECPWQVITVIAM